MTDVVSLLFLAPCDVPGCRERLARWTQTVGETTRIDCPKHPHQPPMHALHAYLRRIG